MIELVVLSTLAVFLPAAAALVAWWVYNTPGLELVGPNRRWEGPVVQRMGLSLTGDLGARGVVHGFVIDVDWRFQRATVTVKGPSVPEPTRVVDARKTLEAIFHGRGWDADPRAQVCYQDAEISSSAQRALLALEATPSDSLVLVTYDREASDLGVQFEGVVGVACWIAERFGWVPSEDSALQALATSDPEPRVRRRSWEKLMGGWPPTPTDAAPLPAPAEGDRRALAELAAADPDPWIAAVGALRLGDAGHAVLLAIASDPEQHVLLVERALRGVWREAPNELLLRLLARSRDGLGELAARALGEQGAAAELAVLRTYRLGIDARGDGARRAIGRIAERIHALGGQLAFAPDDEGEGGLALDGDGGSLALARSPEPTEPRH